MPELFEKPKPLIVIGCGGRDFIPDGETQSCMQEALVTRDVRILIQGGARGGDAAWKKVAEGTDTHGIQCDANWRRYGRRAGIVRNEFMLRTGLDLAKVAGCDLEVWALPGGVGTVHMMRIALDSCVTVWSALRGFYA